MKTTVEIRDALIREAKAAEAARNSISLKEFFTQAERAKFGARALTRRPASFGEKPLVACAIFERKTGGSSASLRKSSSGSTRKSGIDLRAAAQKVVTIGAAR